MADHRPIADPYVRIWIEQPSGAEVAMLSAADFRAIVAERAFALAENGSLRADLATAQAEVDRLRSQVDNCQANAHYRAWQESQAALVTVTAERDMTRTVVEAARDVLNHDCDECRLAWCAEREAIVDRMRSALDAAPDLQQALVTVTAERDQLQATLDHAIETMNDQTVASYHLLAVNERRDAVVEAARVSVSLHESLGGWGQRNCHPTMLRQALAALDTPPPDAAHEGVGTPGSILSHQEGTLSQRSVET